MALRQPIYGECVKKSVFILLLLVAVGVSLLVFVVPSTERRFLGVCLASAGILNILWHRRLALQILRWVPYMPKSLSAFWVQIGTEGARLLYLWIGLILLVAGLSIALRSLL